MGGASGAGGSGPGSAINQLNGKTLADTPNTLPGNIYQQIFNQGRDPAEMAASKASWMNGAMGQSPDGSSATSQPQPMTLDQTLARLTQGMPQSQQSAQMPQQVAAQAPLQASVQSQAGMPIFNQPAISPMQQYMQSIGINRAPYNPGKFYNAGSQGYAAWRAPQNFQPQLTPQMTAASTAAAKPQQSELDKLRAELEDMRARQYGSYNNTGGGGGN